MNDIPFISCYLKDCLEQIARLKSDCIITYLNEKNKSIEVRGQIVDIYDNNGKEWCELKDGTTICLDRIGGFQPQ